MRQGCWLRAAGRSRRLPGEHVPSGVEIEVAVLSPRPLVLRACGVFKSIETRRDRHEERTGVATATVAAEEHALPERVQESLGELVGAAKEGLLALSVGVGLGVMHELMACEVEEACGPRGKHDPERVAYRHGSDDGQVTLGGRRVAVERPRSRTRGHQADRHAQTRGGRYARNRLRFTPGPSPKFHAR